MKEVLNRVVRRVLQAMGRGRVTAVNDGGVVQMLQVQLNPLETIDNVPRLAEFGLTSNPPDGASVAMMFIGGDRSNGVVVATGDQKSRPTGLLSGETMVYNLVGIKIYLSKAGLSIDGAGLPVSVSNTPTVTVTAGQCVVLDTPLVHATQNLQVDGSITAGQDITDNASAGGKSMAVMRQDHDEHGHPVTGIQSGSSSVVSGTPTVTE
jgi:phage baseplate assembly protein V